MSFTIGDMVPYEQHKRAIEKVSRQLEQERRANTDMKYMLLKAKGILEAKFTKSNLTNAIITLESLPSKSYMMKFVVSFIMKSAKTPNNYCGVIKRKCASTGRIYFGFNKIYNNFDNLPDWFVYETFKEKAIKSVPGSFSLRFMDALVAFILNQQKYEERNMRTTSKS
jgi:hypothetical protein